VAQASWVVCPKGIKCVWTNTIKQGIFQISGTWPGLIYCWKALLEVDRSKQWFKYTLEQWVPFCALPGVRPRLTELKWGWMQCGRFVLTSGLNFSSGGFGAVARLLGYKADFEPVLPKIGSSSDAAARWLLRERSLCCVPSPVCIDQSSRATWQGH